MSHPAIIGFSGNLLRPSKTREFVAGIANEIAQRTGLASRSYDIVDLGDSFLKARWAAELDAQASRIAEDVRAAEVLVVDSPTYKGSYTGLFKHFFDLLDPAALRGKPILLTATGGGERHSLMVEHQLRPLFAFFEALSLPTAIYAADRDFVDGKLASPAILARREQAIVEAEKAISHRKAFLDIAAE